MSVLINKCKGKHNKNKNWLQYDKKNALCKNMQN